MTTTLKHKKRGLTLNNETAIFTPAQPADIELLLRFNRELNEVDGTPFHEARTRTALINLIGRPDLGKVWLIGAAGRPAGYLVLTWGYSLEFGGRDAFIDELYLEAGQRGRGLGRQAIRFAEEQCRNEGVLALHLEVERDNARARSFYGKTGFASRARYFLMSKRLVFSDNFQHNSAEEMTPDNQI